MSFEVKKTEFENNCPGFAFIGEIDEEAVFPQLTEMPAEVVIDLNQVGAINSIGIRAWILWFNQFPETKFSFRNCPKALVMQMNMVEGFLPAKHEVLSIEVPFYCEDCDQEKNVMFHVGKEIHVKDGKVELNYDKSSVCGSDCSPELDVSEVKFFRFLLQTTDEQAA